MPIKFHSLNINFPAQALWDKSYCIRIIINNDWFRIDFFIVYEIENVIKDIPSNALKKCSYANSKYKFLQQRFCDE